MKPPRFEVGQRVRVLAGSDHGAVGTVRKVQLAQSIYTVALSDYEEGYHEHGYFAWELEAWSE